MRSLVGLGHYINFLNPPELVDFAGKAALPGPFRRGPWRPFLRIRVFVIFSLEAERLIAPGELQKTEHFFEGLAIYPIEVIACAEFPKGQKAHETVITVDAKPSEVHKALESLGLKAGKPAAPGGEDSVAISGDLKACDASVIFRGDDNLTAVASVGRDLENLKAELALERGDEFHAF